MPRKVTAFACKYRCGQRVTTKVDDMYRHEMYYCIKNPIIKACPTCKHNNYETWSCEIDKLPEDKNLIKNCEFWEAE